MGLLAVPRALGPQHGARPRRTAPPRRRPAAASRRHVDRRQVVGLDGAVELVPRHRQDLLVGEAEPRPGSRTGLGRGDVDGELDVGQDLAAVALAHEQRPALPRGLDREPVRRRRCGRPRRSGRSPSRAHARSSERQRREDLDLDAVVGDEQLDGALGDDGRAGHRVQHLAVLGRRRDQALDDRRVHVLDRGRPTRRRRRRTSRRAPPTRRGDAWCGRSGRRSTSSSAIVPTVSRSAPPGPRPTTVTRGAIRSGGGLARSSAGVAEPRAAGGSTGAIDAGRGREAAAVLGVHRDVGALP